MTILLVILAILLVGGTVLFASGRPLRRVGLVEPVAPLPPVLLPENPSARDVDALRFGLGLRGYRMDQVDEVLDRLAAVLEERDAVVADLRSQLAAVRGAAR